MQNPYKVLGLREGAPPDEVKKAYRELVKKYHPDQYADNPLKDLAEQKLQEINEAYRLIMQGASGYDGDDFGFNGPGFGSSDFADHRQNYYSDDNLFSEAIDALDRNDLFRAESILNSIRQRNARWFYLMGLVNYRRNRFGEARDCFRTAVNMDPGNPEYAEAFHRMNRAAENYRQKVYYTTRRDNDDCCRALCTLWICDTCCECMGGDLCTCC